MTTTDTTQVRDFWESRARAVANDGEVTHSDVWQRWLEIETIKRFLSGSDRAIDVGCGNGYATRQIGPLVRRILGIDYTEAMIERAIGSPAGDRTGTGNVEFAVCDVLELEPERFGLFDVAVSARCLINLASWDDQKRAIANIGGVLREGGRFLFIEGSADARLRLNELRESVGLEAMPPVWYNVNFDESELLSFLDEHFVVEQRLNFGVYDLISRVAHPLMVAPEKPNYRSRINEVAARLALRSDACGDISRVIFLVLRKKP